MLPEKGTFLKSDLDIKCFSNEHLKLLFSIGLPSILIWVIGFPLFIFLKMRSNRHQLISDRNFNKVYGLFYIGLKEDMYYWEIAINNIRKIVIISANTFL